jgi:hypothetical protein
LESHSQEKAENNISVTDTVPMRVLSIRHIHTLIDHTLLVRLDVSLVHRGEAVILAPASLHVTQGTALVSKQRINSSALSTQLIQPVSELLSSNSANINIACGNPKHLIGLLFPL